MVERIGIARRQDQNVTLRRDAGSRRTMKQYSIFPNGKFQHLNFDEKETWCGLKINRIGISKTNNRADNWPICTECVKEHDATVCCNGE